VKELFSGDVYVGLSGIDLEPDEFDLGEGITIRKTYAHLMAHFIMAFAPPALGQPHPGPWKAATGGSGFTSDVSVEIRIPGSHAERFSIAETVAFMLRLRIDPATSLTVVSNYAFSDLPTVSDRNAKIVPVEVHPRYFPLSTADSLATPQRLEWIREYWKSTHSLMSQSTEFALAVAAINTGQFVHNTALVLVSLWAAVHAESERILSINSAAYG